MAFLQTCGDFGEGFAAAADADGALDELVAFGQIDELDGAFAEEALHGDGQGFVDLAQENAGFDAHAGLELGVVLIFERDADGVFAQVGVAPTAGFGHDADGVDDTFEGTAASGVDLEIDELARADATGDGFVDAHGGDHFAGVGQDDDELVGIDLLADLPGTLLVAPAAAAFEAGGVDDEAVLRGDDGGGSELVVELAHLGFEERELFALAEAIGVFAGELAVVVQLDAIDFGAGFFDVAELLLALFGEFEVLVDLGGEGGVLVFGDGFDVGHFVAVTFVFGDEAFAQEVFAAAEFFGKALEVEFAAADFEAEFLAALDDVAVFPLLQAKLGEFELQFGFAECAGVVVELNLVLIFGGDDGGAGAGEARGLFIDLRLDGVAVELDDHVAFFDARAFGDDGLDGGVALEGAAKLDLIFGLEVAVGGGGDVEGLLADVGDVGGLGLGGLRGGLGCSGEHACAADQCEKDRGGDGDGADAAGCGVGSGGVGHGGQRVGGESGGRE